MVWYLVLGVLAIVIFLFVVQPLWAARQRPRSRLTRNRLFDLLAQRDALLQSLRDLELDRETGKVSESDYEGARLAILREASIVVSQLDVLEHQLEQEVEQEIAHLRELARKVDPLSEAASTSS